MATLTEVERSRLRVVEEHVASENRHDLDGIMETFGQAAQYDDASWEERHDGRTRVRSYYSDLMRALPDLKIDVKKTHVTAESVILEVEIAGTHRGMWRGLPGTGRPVRFPLCAVYAFDDQNRLVSEKI